MTEVVFTRSRLRHVDRSNRPDRAPTVEAKISRAPAGASQHSHPSPSLRRRKQEASPLVRGLNRVGSMLHTAHAQDFERKRKDGDVGTQGGGDGDDTSDEDDEDGAATPRSVDEERDEAVRLGEAGASGRGKDRDG